MIKVYLAGRIKENDLEYAVEWRQEAVKALASQGMLALNPLDGFVTEHYIRHDFVTNELIFHRDVDMLEEADAIILNTKDLVGGLGSMFEIGYAYAHGLPIYVVNLGSIQHPFIQHSATAIYLTECYDVVAEDMYLHLADF